MTARSDLPLIGDYSSPETSLSGARIGVVTFPGTLDDRDAARAVRLAGGQPVASGMPSRTPPPRWERWTPS